MMDIPQDSEHMTEEDFSGFIEEDFSVCLNFEIEEGSHGTENNCRFPFASLENLPVRKRKKDTVPRNPHPKRGKQAMDQNKVKEVYLLLCCEMHCLNRYSLQQITDARNEFWSRSRHSQRKFIYKGLRSRIDEHFIVDGGRLCERGWCALYGVKDRRFQAIKAEMVKCAALKPERQKFVPPSKRYLMAKTWLDGYVKVLSDKQPNKDEQHLPSCLTKDAIYKMYVENIEKAEEIPVSVSSFKEMWLRDFPNVKISKGKGSHFQCTHCNNYTTTLLQQRVRKTTERIMLDMRSEHLNLHTECRQKYYKHRKKSKLNPEKYISVIIDNMNSGKTKLPRSTSNVKADASLPTMQHHITGVKCHGLNRTYIYTWTDAQKSDCNITINCLLYVLHDISKEQDRMPETLYIQADNSGKDNKNNYMLLFLAYLVYKGIFRKVKFSFLMVGHTHEDIDAMFSCIWKKLRQQDAPTLPKLHSAVKTCVEPVPVVDHMSSQLDFRARCQESRVQFSGFQAVHHFTIKIVDGRVKLLYKDWPADPYQSLDMTDSLETVNLGLVINTPMNEKIVPVMSNMQSNIHKYTQAGRMEEEDRMWWEDYLHGIERASREKPITPLVSDLPKFSSVTETTVNTNTLSAMREHQRRLGQKSVIKQAKRRR